MLVYPEGFIVQPDPILTVSPENGDFTHRMCHGDMLGEFPGVTIGNYYGKDE
jgi:hypothetical protein